MMRKYIDIILEGSDTPFVRKERRKKPFGRRESDQPDSDAAAKSAIKDRIDRQEDAAAGGRAERRLGQVTRRAKEIDEAKRKSQITQRTPKKKCSACNGSGYYDNTGRNGKAPKCSSCRGTGYDKPKPLNEETPEVSSKAADEIKTKIADALTDLGYAFSSECSKETPDPALNAMVKDCYCAFDVQFAKKKVRARDILTELARETGFDYQVDYTTQADDGSTWLHCSFRENGDMVAVASARDASRHREHPDFGSYLFICIKNVDDEPESSDYSKKEYMDTDQRECVKITNPAGEVVYDGPKRIFKESILDETLLHVLTQNRLFEIIKDGLDNHSGAAHGSIEAAVEDIMRLNSKLGPNPVTRQGIDGIIRNIDSYDPYEGFDGIDFVVNEICKELGVLSEGRYQGRS